MTTFERIKKLAKKRGFSLQDVAEQAEIGINTIYKWKNYDPKGTDLSKVANVLNTTTDYLLLRTDDPINYHSKDTGKSDGTALTWDDLGVPMPYGGHIPDDLKETYSDIAKGYFKRHPEFLNKDE